MKPAYLHSLLLAAVLALFAGGCAQDLDEIDTVQPNYVKKSDLLGREWYLRTTVVGTTFTSAYTFPGEMGTLVRGVFEVQEDALYFYRTYEFMLGSEAYAMKGDTDVPLKGKDGKPVTRAVPQDYQKIACTTNADCGPQAWCGDAARAGKIKDEEDWHGFCVREGRQYVYRGAPVLAFPISSHFDITYMYSSASGEKTNRRYENTSDRKWFDREYMRVSWGSQQLVDFDGDVTGGILASASAAPVIYEGDTAPEGEQFELCTDGKVCKQAYLTYMHRLVASAPTVYYDEEYGDIPLCYFYPWYAGGVYDCASEEVKVRTFFLEVPDYSKDPTKAYVAREQDDVEFEKFGYFRTERPVYDIEFGVAYNNAVRRAQRHRIWDRYVKCYVNAKGDPGPCQAAGDGRVWKGDFDYAKMTPQPIVYYLNEDHPRELVAAANAIAKSWSEPFEQVVAFHKNGQKPDHPMFVLCENNNTVARAAAKVGHVTAEYGDTAIGKRFCEDMDQPHRFGDLRYNYMHAVPANIQIGLYGYGPSAADPITGEIVAASAHAYTSQMKLGAEGALQAIELQAGIKDHNDVKYSTEKEYFVGARRFKHYDQKGPKSTEELRTQLAGMMDPDVRQRLETSGLQLVDNGGSYAQSRMARIQQNPALDAALVGNDPSYSINALFRDPSVTPGKLQNLTADKLEKISLANWAHIAGLRERRKVFDDLAKKTLHFRDFTDNAIVAVSEEYGRRYDEALCKAFASATTPTLYGDFSGPAAAGEACTTPLKFEPQGMGQGRLCVKVGTESRWADCSSKILMDQLRGALITANGTDPIVNVYHEMPSPLYTDTMDPLIRSTQEIGREVVTKLRGEIKNELWARIFKGTQEHEVGHTLGLRHNFEASTDALNYHAKYWTLKVDAKGDPIHLWEPESANQASGDMRTLQMASIMDYGAKFNSEFAGVGMYDRAAIKFGYGDIVEAFNNPPDLEAAPGGELAPMADYLATPTQDDPGAQMLLHQGNQAMQRILRRVHYSTLPKYFGSAANLYDRKDVRWSSLKGDRCVSDSECGDGKVCRQFGEDKYCADAKTVEVPYRFCSDEMNGETPTCATWDEGADPYEIARNALDAYEQYWFFMGYARDSEMFYPDNYAARVEGAFFTAVRQFQFWAIDFASYQKDGWWKKRYGRDFDQDVNGGLSGAYATANTFNKLAQVIARPSPGYFCWNAGRNRFEPYNSLDSSGCPDYHWFDELNGGRQMYPSWGGGYAYRPITAGQIYDRIAAFTLLSDPTTPAFTATNEQEDLRRYLVSFFNVFPRQMIQLFGGVSVEDAEFYGWLVLQGPPDPDTGNETSNFDYLVPRKWVGDGANFTYKRCAELPVTSTPEQKTGCLKYIMFPDPRPIFPSTRFRMPLLGAYYGMSLLTQGFDRSFMDLSRVFLKGNEAAIELPNGVETAEFTDPLSGKVYVAAKTSDDTLNPGYMAVKLAAAELAKFPNIEALQQSYLFSEYQFRVSLLDLIRSMHETYEY